jgi:hypothetical protein
MIARLWPLLAGFTLWALALVALYGLQLLGCRFGWPPEAHRVALVAAYAVSLGLMAILLATQIALGRRQGSGPMKRIGIGTTLAALFAAAITLSPTLMASACV